MCSCGWVREGACVCLARVRVYLCIYMYKCVCMYDTCMCVCVCIYTCICTCVCIIFMCVYVNTFYKTIKNTLSLCSASRGLYSERERHESANTSTHAHVLRQLSCSLMSTYEGQSLRHVRKCLTRQARGDVAQSQRPAVAACTSRSSSMSNL